MEDGTPFGRYRLLDLLGRGGMGEVWRAFDTVTERVVALKVLPTQLADDAVYQERFRREARSAAALDEPHVVPIHDFGEIDGRLFVTMRLIKGSDLHTILREGRMDSARAVGIIDQVASALHAAHQVNLIHRDVKPSNILVGDDDFAYLIDFGIARAAGQSGLTSSSSVIGTWAYMAPERLTTGQTDARADVYALACVLYECLTGSQPFPGESLEQQIGGHIALAPPRASERHRDVSAHLDEVIAKGMAKNPDERYSTTRELAFAAKSAVTAPIPRPAPPAPTPPTPPAPTTPAPFANPWAGPQPQPSSQQSYVTSRATFVPPPPPPPPPPPAGPTHFGGPPAPAQNWYPPPGPAQNWAPQFDPNSAGPKQSRKTLLIAVSSIAVVAIVAIVAAIVLLNSGGKDDPISTPPTPLANSGPFTGTFSVAFGPKVYGSGNPVANAPPATTETWRVRSECGDNGCVANASNDGKLAAKDLVFDKIGDSWLAVTTSTAPCKNIDAEAWNVISLEPQVDGTMTGEMTQSTTNACFNKRTVTFTRTGDADVGSLPDPATEPKRTPSPAEAFRGRYHNELVFSDGDKQEYDYDVKTACLRTGERCNSSFVDPTGDSADSMVFASGKWNRNIEYDATVCTTDGNRIILTGEFPLPQPTQDPIALLTGHTHQESTSPSCGDWEVEEKFIRSGD